MRDKFFGNLKKCFNLIVIIFLLPSLHSSSNSIDDALFCGKASDSEIISLHIDYKNGCSELCLIGAKYDTDKSSQRKDVSSYRHCHPYTLFYHSLFKNMKDAQLNIAELGILYGASLRMWGEYFKNANLYGFDYDVNLINSYLNNFNIDRTVLRELNVKDRNSIMQSLETLGQQFDLVIEDTTHEFEDQVRVIESLFSYLKPGGMLIIEDISKSYSEKDYIERLKPILNEFQDYYFVTLDHNNRCSDGWDNDKLFVLVKAGAEPIFKNRNKITIITPCCRPSNLIKLKESIDFRYVDEWMIVYDGTKVSNNPNIFQSENNDKIKEYVFTDRGRSGNAQRNFALDQIKNEDTYLYFLDDDNLIYKDFYKLLDVIDSEKIYTFNQKNRLKGSCIQVGSIDTAMFLISYKLCKNIRWIEDRYDADGYYILDCYNNNKDKWVFVDNVLSTYNVLIR